MCRPCPLASPCFILPFTTFPQSKAPGLHTQVAQCASVLGDARKPWVQRPAGARTYSGKADHSWVWWSADPGSSRLPPEMVDSLGVLSCWSWQRTKASPGAQVLSKLPATSHPLTSRQATWPNSKSRAGHQVGLTSIKPKAFGWFAAGSPSIHETHREFLPPPLVSPSWVMTGESESPT